MSEIKCTPLKRVIDTPIFGQGEGICTALQNMEIHPGGYAEARGGLEKMKPSGGTVTDAYTIGAYSAVHQVSSPYGFITYENGGVMGQENRQLQSAPWLPFFGGILDDAVYFVSALPFPSVSVSLSVAANWTVTIVKEYWNGSIWTTPTSASTIDWTVLRTPQKESWIIPSTWTPRAIGGSGNQNIYGYAMRIRLSVVTAVVTAPYIAVASIAGTGIKQVLVASQDPVGAATDGRLFQYGQFGTIGQFYSVTSGLTASKTNPTRMASYRGRTVLVNGAETKSWNGSEFLDLGVPGSTINFTLTRQAGGSIDVGIYRYYVAVGNGPCDNTAVYAAQQDVLARFGPGRASLLIPTGGADPADANSIQTTAGNQTVRFTLTGALSLSISSLYLYRTQDLTLVPVGQRGNFPAFLVQSLRCSSGGSLETSPYNDTNQAAQFPPQEALTFDVSPPTGCKYVTVFQNRLILADDETIYWSDPFKIDIFSSKATNFIRLAKATGGRIVGIKTFGDQIVAWTEDETWGITNLDLDVPTLYPIAMGIGLVASDAAASRDGRLIWPAKDGFHEWDGGREGPKKISLDMDQTFQKLSYESHGGSRATISSGRYLVRLADPIMASPGLAYQYRFDTGRWNTVVLAGFTSTLFPLATIDAPIGNSDAGTAHPVWAKCDYGTGAGDYSIFLGELTTQDNGTGYVCSGTMHFPTPPPKMFAPRRAIAYYLSDAGWGTPTLASAAADIGSTPGALTAGTPDVGTDYSIVTGAYASSVAGTSDLKVTFSATTTGSGTVGRQRLHGAVLEGEWKDLRRGA